MSKDNWADVCSRLHHYGWRIYLADLAHLRRHLPGLHEITPKEHNAMAKAALDKAIAAKAGACKPREG